MKRTIALSLVFGLMLLLLACCTQSLYIGKLNLRNNQMDIGTTWRSEDGKIQFTVQLVNIKTILSDGRELGAQTVYGIGTMETDIGLIDIWIYEYWDYDSEESGCGGFTIKEAPKDAYGPKTALEEGMRGPLDNGTVLVTFTQTTYLEENAVIMFYRVAEVSE